MSIGFRRWSTIPLVASELQSIIKDHSEDLKLTAMIYSANGGATLTQPPGGFNQAGMSTVFAAFASSTSTAPASTTTIPTETTSAAPSSGPALSGGAIGGIAVGAVAIVSLIAVGIWFFFRKRRERRELATPLPPPPPTGPNKGWVPNPSELQGPYVPPRMELHSNHNVVKVELPGNSQDAYNHGAQQPYLSEGPHEAPA